SEMFKYFNFLLSTLLTSSLLLHNVTEGHIQTHIDNRCPEEDIISPCQCTYWTDSDTIDLDCSLVESEEQLRQIFNSDLNITGQATFYMGRNENIKVLRNDVLGAVSFVDIIVIHGALEVVQAGALSQSEKSLKILKFVDNNLYEFPFDTIEYMPELNILDVSQNNISFCPLLINNKTKEVSLRLNPLKNIQVEAFLGLASLKRLDLENTDLVSIEPGFLSGLSVLETVYLGHNHLTHIQQGVFDGELHNLQRVDLSDNSISLVEPNAFQVAKEIDINLWQNELSILDELVWRPLFDVGISFNIYGNPLACGCDIAWLWQRSEYLAQVSDAQCAEGVAVQDIDPSRFDDC
ncbi:unnamed protein product, partial [Meganyctiphanes norvegica]